MGSSAKNAAFIFALIFIPLTLGVLIVGPEVPLGRSSRSVSAAGHKAYFLLLERLGYQPRRFERGVETLPQEDAALIALEPGGALFRQRGRYARGLRAWIEEGRAALITLGPDPDLAAQRDDPERLFQQVAKRAQAAAQASTRKLKAKQSQDEAKAKDKPKTEAKDKSKPEAPAAEELQREALDPEEPWAAANLAGFLGLQIDDGRLMRAKFQTPLPLEGPLAERLGDKPTIALTRPRVFSGQAILRGEEEPGFKTLLSVEGRPLLLEMPLGKGRVWLLSEPRLLQNGALMRGSHALLGVRLAEMLSARSGAKKIYFEEFSHGGREAANIMELIAQTSARWPMMQLLLATLVGVWMLSGQRRSPVPLPEPPRRSKDEVIDAMASLYLRSGDLEGTAARWVELCRLELASAIASSERSAEGLARALGARLGRAPGTIAPLLSVEGLQTAEAVLKRSRALVALLGEVRSR